ncbi:MAG: tetratricopeptide repeat protein [Bacteroidetes bacterium]|nr:tetratricopeptide repeat protein [Bacteroidota bacterium]
MYRILLMMVVFIQSESVQAQDSCSIWVREAHLYMDSGHYKTVILLTDKCLAENPAHAEACNLRGCATILQGAINHVSHNWEAVTYFNRAIAADSTHPYYLNNRGWAYQTLEEYTRAINDFRKAAKLDTGNVVLEGNILRQYFIRNKNKEALSLCNKLIARFPENGYAWYVRGQLKRDYLHHYAEGNKDVKKGEELGWQQGYNLMY